MHADFGTYAKSTNSNSYINIIFHPKYVMGTREVFLYNAKYNVMKKKNLPTNFFCEIEMNVIPIPTSNNQQIFPKYLKFSKKWVW